MNLTIRIAGADSTNYFARIFNGLYQYGWLLDARLMQSAIVACRNSVLTDRLDIANIKTLISLIDCVNSILKLTPNDSKGPGKITLTYGSIGGMKRSFF